MADVPATLAVIQDHVGCCREWVEEPRYQICGKPAEFVIWGKLAPTDSLGPRCYDHARKHLSGHALVPRSNYALINLRDLAEDLNA